MNDPQEENFKTTSRADWLLQRFFDQEITEQECSELLELWEHSPQLTVDAQKNYEIEHFLQFLSRMQSSRQRQVPFAPMPPYVFSFCRPDGQNHLISIERLSELAALQSIAAPQEEPASQSPFPSQETLAPGSRVFKTDTRVIKSFKFGFLHKILLVTLLFFGVLAVYSEFFRMKPTSTEATTFHSIGTVTAAVDVQWMPDSEPLKPGQQFESGKILFRSGLLELILTNDVRLILEGPIDLQLNSPASTFCTKGRISAAVPEKGKGFEVITPFLTLVDLGTEFFLHVSETDAETHVIDGQVKLLRIPSGKIDLSGGKAMRIDGKGKSESFTADSIVFLDKKDVRKKVFEAETIEMSRWQRETEVLNRMPGLILHFDFENNGAVEPNRSDSGHVVAMEGRLNGPTRCDGRWHGKKGIVFRGKRDMVEIDVPHELRSMALVAFVRIDGLNRFNQLLLSSQSLDGEYVHWQLAKGGSFLLAFGGNGSPAQRYKTPVQFPRSKWGAWYGIACVVDAEREEVLHYIDGHCVASSKLQKKEKFRIGPAMIGNGLSRDIRDTNSSFDGAMDQWMIFDRALSPEEIQTLHLVKEPGIKRSKISGQQ